MRSLALGILALSCTVPNLARSEESAPTLAWRDIVAHVHDLPSVRHADTLATAAQGAILQARSIPMPEADIRLGQGLPRSGGAGDLTWGLEVTVPLDWVAPRAALIRAAKAKAEAGRREVAQARRDALARLAVLFQRAAHGQRLAQTLQSSEARFDALVARIRKRVEAGEARPTDLSRAEGERERVRLDRERAQADGDADRDALAALLGRAWNPSIRIDAPDNLPNPPAPLPDCIQAALGTHPGLAAVRELGRAAGARLDAERARRLPGLALGAYYARELDQDAVGALIQVRLPSWDLNTGAIRQARAAWHAQEQAALAQALEVRAAVSGAWTRCTQRRAAALRFADDVLPRTESTALAIEQAFVLGEASLMDVLDVQRALVETRKESLESRFEARIECLELHQMTGEDDAT